MLTKKQEITRLNDEIKVLVTEILNLQDKLEHVSEAAQEYVEEITRLRELFNYEDMLLVQVLKYGPVTRSRIRTSEKEVEVHLFLDLFKPYRRIETFLWKTLKEKLVRLF